MSDDMETGNAARQEPDSATARSGFHHPQAAADRNDDNDDE